MSTTVRARAPWVIWAFVTVLLVSTLVLLVLNGNFGGEDALFTPIALIMVVAYSTVGALLASRNPSNAIGWLLMSVGVAFALTGSTSEYLEYAYVTNPGSLPAGAMLALISNLFWLPMLTAVILLALLFPSGTVPGPRWRYVPRGLLGLAAVAWLAGVFFPGEIEQELGGARLENPIGIQALEPVINAVTTVGWFGVLVVGPPLAITALILRYRSSRGEERQQLRWLAYTGATFAVALVLSYAGALILGEEYGDTLVADVLFIAALIPVAIGIPLAVGVAVLKYRLYDLDLVVKKTVLYAVVAALLVGAFAVVAVAVGAIAGRTGTGAVVAAGAIGVLFWPAVRLARRVADRIVYGRRATPYEVLAEFSARVGGSYGDEDVLPRMADILRDAVGADQATVWLRVGNELRPAALAPRASGTAVAGLRIAGDDLPAIEADLSAEVRDRGELLGALAVSMPANDPITLSKERLVRDLAAQAGLVLRNVRLIEELRASRQRLVASQDQERRRLERDLHDGAQQQLVALQVKQRLVASMLERDPGGAKELLAQLQANTAEALDDLRDLARGIYPPLLADKGLAEAIQAQARKSPIPVRVEADGIGRYGPEAEAATYFCTLEALQNVSKYAKASSVEITLRRSGDALVFSIRDDGIGFDLESARGSGLENMRDRMEALGGSLDVETAPAAGTTVRGRLPVSRTGRGS
ncbi:MAG TPA: histidine kinase [Actinomycetota bacterium]|nr:histidine kinase [Actinomycetota bacterium]